MQRDAFYHCFFFFLFGNKIQFQSLGQQQTYVYVDDVSSGAYELLLPYLPCTILMLKAFRVAHYFICTKSKMTSSKQPLAITQIN